MELRRCVLCGQDRVLGAGTTTFVCDACLGPSVLETMQPFVRAEDRSAFLSLATRVPTIDLGDFEIDDQARRSLPRELCVQHVVVPVSRMQQSLIVAVTDPRDSVVLDELREETGLSIEPVIASAEAIRATIARYWP